MLTSITTELSAELKKLTEFASQPENWFDPLHGKLPKARHQDFERILPAEDGNGYAVMFTYTVQLMFNKIDPTKSFPLLTRHTGIVKVNGDPPDKAAVLEICKHLGYEGGLDDWMILPHPTDANTCAIIQTIMKLPNAVSKSQMN